MRVLAAGVGSREVAEQLFPDGAVVDYTDAKPSKKQTGYDAILLFHVLQRVSFRDWANSIGMWKDRLKDGGELHIFVPSLEWAAEQILSEEPSPLTMQHLFGKQSNSEEFHISGWTMERLRNVLETSGLKVKYARSGDYALVQDGKEIVAEHHYVLATK